MAFPIDQVPIMGRPAPMQLPQHYDPASIIMQAAALRQQRDLAHAQMQQKSVEDITQTIQSAAALQEHKRETLVDEQRAQAMLDMAQGKIPMEQAQMGAHIGYLQAQKKLAEAQAGAFSGSGGVGDAMQNVHNGKLSYNTWIDGFSSRNGQKAAMQNLYATTFPNDSPSQLEIEYQKNLTSGKALGGQSPTVQKIDSLFTQINRFDKLASMVPKTAMDIINRSGLQIAAAGIPGADPSVKVHASNLLQQTRILSDEAQSTFGSGSDAKLALGSAIFDPNPNPSTIMSDNQIARYSLLSRRNGLDSKPDGFIPPSFSAQPPRETVSSYLARMKDQGIQAQSVVPVVHQMVSSGLLDDDISGGQ